MKKNTQKLQLKNCPKILIIFFVNVYFSDFSCKKKRNALTLQKVTFTSQFLFLEKQLLLIQKEKNLK